MHPDASFFLDQLTGTVRHLARGEVLFREGEAGQSFFVVQSGRLRALRGLGTARPTLVGDIGRGELVGEMAVLSEAPRSASVVAVRDSYVVEVSGADLAGLTKETLIGVMRILAQRIRRMLDPHTRGTRPACVVVVPALPDLPLDDYTERLADSLSLAGGQCLRLRASEVPAEFSPLGPADGEQFQRLGRWLSSLEQPGRLLLLQADYAATPWTERVIRQADLVLLLARAGDTPEQSPAERALARLDHLTRPRLDLVLLQRETPYQGTAAWLAGRDVIRHYHVRLGSAADKARAGRMLSGHDVSFALGGGGARGFAHVGMLRAAAELGLPVDRFGGTSMGSVIAALAAMGLGWEDITARLREQFIPAKRLSDWTLPLLSIDTSRRYVRALEALFGTTQIEDLPLNFFCVSCNLTRAAVVVHRTGPLAKWISASMSMPGIAPPLIERGEMLVDGGLLNNLPVDIAKADGAGLVVGVDVSPATEFRLPAHYSGRPQALDVLLSRLRRKRPPQPGELEQPVFPTLADLVHRACSLSSVYQQARLREQADVYLRVATSAYRLLDFDHLDPILELGYRHGLQHLPPVAAWACDPRLPRPTSPAPPAAPPAPPSPAPAPTPASA